MGNPRQTDGSHDANVANDLSRSFATLIPRSSEDVGPFLFEAAYALGESEADLARAIGVSRATLSGWKTRGAIPAQHMLWFSREFVVAVLTGLAPKQHEGFRHAGLEAVLALFQETDFDPFGRAGDSPEARISLCRRHIGGLSRLALFIMHRPLTLIGAADPQVVRLLSELAREAAPQLRFP